MLSPALQKPRPVVMALAPLLSAALMLLSFPPFELYLPPFIALVPILFYIDRSATSGKAAAGTFLFGLAYWLGLLYWLTLFTKAGYVVTATIMAGVFALFAWAVRRLRERLGVPLVVSVPLVWTTVNYLHAHSDVAFPWGQLCNSLSYAPVWLQMASITGAYGINMWLAGVNVVVYSLLAGGTAPGYRKRMAWVLAALIIAPPAFGLVRYALHPAVEAEAGTIRVAYVQPSIAQDIKWLPETRDSTFFVLRDLSLVQRENKPDLVVWPEAATPAHIRFERKYQQFVANVARDLGADLLTGSPEYRWDSLGQKYLSYNSAFHFGPDGRLLEGYDKMHLVPVSERFPYEDIFTSLQEIDVGGSHFIPGERYTIFEIERLQEKFAVLICFESIFPQMSRRFVRDGATFLVNITNDAWFEDSPAAAEHASFLVLRAIEQGREIVRAANTGVSGFYDRLGRRRGATAMFEVTSGTDTIHTYTGRTLYSYLGDWPAHPAWIGTLLLLGLSFRRSSQ